MSGINDKSVGSPHSAKPERILNDMSDSGAATRTRILDDIKTAMKAKDKARLAVLRLISADIKQREVDERCELDEDATIAVLEKMLKQRKESISQYEQAGRDDLLAQEVAEVDIIKTYMPEALPAEQIEAMIREAMEKTGAASMKDMGKVIGMLKPRLQGKADMGDVSAQVKALLGNAG